MKKASTNPRTMKNPVKSSERKSPGTGAGLRPFERTIAALLNKRRAARIAMMVLVLLAGSTHHGETRKRCDCCHRTVHINPGNELDRQQHDCKFNENGE